MEEKLITQEQFDAALAKHKETKVTVRQTLIDMGFISEDKLMEFMGVSLDIPVMRDLASKITDPAVIKMIPEKVCEQYTAIPLFKVKNILTIAMADPLDVFAIDDLESIAKCKVEPVLGKRDEIKKVITKLYEAKGSLEEVVRQIAQEAEDMEIIRDKEQKQDINQEESQEIVDAQDAPIIRLVDTMISQAVKQRASDIHIEPEEEKLRVRYRVDGVLREAMVPPKRLQDSIISRIKIMASMDISIKRAPQDGRFRMIIEQKDIDVRVSTVPTTYGEKVVMRLLDQTSIKKGLGDSGFDKKLLSEFKDLIERPYGIILVTGPTGSGKTTTLYLALQTINSPDKNIITIEDPVEYELKGINQISVNVKAGVTFAQGLRSILRQDPDVIMVGEIRDVETADIAVRAALTGHLVFSTLHTNDAASSVIRMVDMGLPHYLVASSVCGVLAQRLVRTICSKCKESYQPSADEIDQIGAHRIPEGTTFYKGKGCEECGNTGYAGRMAIFELMLVDKELRALIHAKKPLDDIKAAASKAGMKTLWEDGLEKIKAGLTTLEEVQKVAISEGN